MVFLAGRIGFTAESAENRGEVVSANLYVLGGLSWSSVLDVRSKYTSPMNNNRVAAIEEWFREHEDGDFSIVSVKIPSARGGNILTARTLIYTTKQHCLSRIEVGAFVQPVATLARYGLPSRDDLDFLRGGSEVSRLFFGDADPPDLLVFAWLREHVPIQWAGVSDVFLNSRSYDGSPSIHIRLSDSERATIAELGRLCPNYRELVGESCALLLENGMKIELEGALAH